MYILRIEHRVASYGAWKNAFDSDPIGRRRSGVRRHRIMRTRGAEDDITIDLEFGSLESAVAVLAALEEQVWKSPQATAAMSGSPRGRIVEVVEDKTY